MKISSQNWPLMIVADKDRNPIDGISASSSEHYVLEKLLELPEGEYKVLREDATIITVDDCTQEQDTISGDGSLSGEGDLSGEGAVDSSDEEPVGTRPKSIEQTLNPDATISFADHHDGGSAYVRWQEVTILNQGDTLDIVVLKGRNSNIAFTGPEYTLFFDDITVDTVQANGEERLTFTPDLSGLEEGWYIASTSENGVETCCNYPVFVYKDGTAQIDWMPSWTESYAQRFDPTVNKIVWVATKFEPITKTLPPRDYPVFSTRPSNSNLWAEMLTGELSNYTRRPCITKEGVMTTANNQWYTWGNFVAKTPTTPLLDGYPGENSFASATHIQIGDARQEDDPDSPLMGNIYVADPWRVCRLSPDGKLTTLFGFKHETLPAYHEDPQNLTLVGDWTAVPEERRQLWELWGFAWFRDTLAVDHTADPIPEEDNRIPHETGPTMAVANTQMHSVITATFDPEAHGVTPIIREIYHGGEIWDVVSYGSNIIVSERSEHRIIELDQQGNIVRTILQGEPLAHVDFSRFVIRETDVETIRQQDVVLPEGLYVLDDWLYFASAAMGQIRRVHLIDGTLEVVVSFNSSGTKGSNYYKIAVSDGTAFPKGTVFMTNWSVLRHGGPRVFKPDGTEDSAISPYDSTRRPRGRIGSGLMPISYNTAVAAKHGRIIFGSVNSGLRQVSLAHSDDPTFSKSRYSAGKQLYHDMNGGYRWGDFGQSFYGDPLPWGQHEDLDYFLEVMGCNNA